MNEKEKTIATVVGWVMAIVMIMWMLMMAVQASAIDKWSVCTPLNLTGQDCDDLWNMITNTSVADHSHNISFDNYYTKDNTDAILGNLNATLSKYVDEKTASTSLLTDPEKEELVKLRYKEELANESLEDFFADLPNTYYNKAEVDQKIQDVARTQTTVRSDPTPKKSGWTDYWPLFALIVVGIGIYYYLQQKNKRSKGNNYTDDEEEIARQKALLEIHNEKEKGTGEKESSVAS